MMFFRKFVIRRKRYNLFKTHIIIYKKLKFLKMGWQIKKSTLYYYQINIGGSKYVRGKRNCFKHTIWM